MPLWKPEGFEGLRITWEKGEGGLSQFLWGGFPCSRA